MTRPVHCVFEPRHPRYDIYREIIEGIDSSIYRAIGGQMHSRRIFYDAYADLTVAEPERIQREMLSACELPEPFVLDIKMSKPPVTREYTHGKPRATLASRRAAQRAETLAMLSAPCKPRVAR